MREDKRIALVLGGGGPVGIAWEAGLIAGLADAGVDLARVDRVIGTSAGAIVGAHLAVTGSVDELYAAQDKPLEELSAPPDFNRLMAAMTLARVLHRTVEGQNRSVAKAALKLKLGGEQEWIARIAAAMPEAAKQGDGWPERELIVTAIDTATGELKLWERGSGVPLPLAVASSCSVPTIFPFVQIEGRVYMDGGMGSPTNAALAAGFGTVIIMDPIARMLGRQSPLGAETKALEAGGARVLSFIFDDATEEVSAKNFMDASRSGLVAEAGRGQAGRWLAASPEAADALGSLRR